MLQIAYSIDMSKERMKLYVSMLSNVNPITLEQSVANLINRCKFLPTIAEIREECSALSAFVNAHEELPTAQDAWERVYQVARSYGYEKGLDQLEGLTKQCAKAIWKSFDPQNGDNFNEMSCRSQFVRNYESQEIRERERLRLSNSIKDNHLLVKAREKAERERALIGAGQKKIEMTTTGNLVEVAKEPVEVAEIINKSKISDKGKELLKQAIGGQMKQKPKEFEVSCNVSFNVSFTVLATSEEQARVKIDNLLEIMRNEATVDCHIHKDYDVYIEDIEASLSGIYYYQEE